jgi:uncharacterized radical SAM protein YgiQ
MREVEGFTKDPRFKGYVSDVGGATADMDHPSCREQLERGMCRGRSCLAPEPCPHLDADHSGYTELLRRLRGIPGVKKVFVRSGVRFDYAMCDKNDDFLRELVEYHVSGQLRVAPEHCSARVLDYMGKPHFEAYERFAEKFERLDKRYGKEQYLVPYLMSSHPGSTLRDAVALAEFLNRTGQHPEQVQDFLSHARDAVDVHVLYRHRPAHDEGGLRRPRPAREGDAARAAAMEEAGDAKARDRGTREGGT